MSFTEVTNTSIFGRLGGAFKGIIVGLVMMVISVPLLFWNEGRAVHRAMTLAQGRGAVVENVASESVDAANEGKLVHMTGTATSQETLEDPKFGIGVDNAIKLHRTVEMFQWEEDVSTKTRKKLGGGEETVKEYSYSKQWSEDQIDSSDFHSQGQSTYGSGNPPMPFSSNTRQASKVDFGAFQLSDSQTGRISQFEDLTLSQSDLDKVPDEAFKAKLKLEGNMLYLGENPQSPQIGDVRVWFSSVGDSDISFIYQQSGNSFQPYQFPKGSIQLFEMGTHSADELFTHAETANKVLTWILRFAGFLLMAFGIGLCLRPLAVMGDIVPFIGGMVGFAIAIVSALVAGGISLIVISIAWLFYRPVLAIILIAVAIGLFILVRKFLPKKPETLPDDGIPVVG